MARIGLGVTGGIGAYKAVEVARLLQKRGHEIRVVMTRSARRFVGPLTFEAITRHPVITSQFAPGMNADIEHVSLAASLDLLVIAPATANSIAKLAHGLADDFLSALYLVTRAPVIVAPAMNTNMWEHASTRANVETLAARGVRFVDPGEGELACGWVGKGRLAEPEAIVTAVEHLLRRRAKTTLAGKRVLVTAGPTIEDLDPVRFIGNRSSGRMGYALADAARERGAEVVLITGPTSLTPPAVSEIVRVRNAREMHVAVMAHAATADAVLMAAAVADYTPAGGSVAQKLEKAGKDEGLVIRLERTPDILAELGTRRGNGERPVLVGFAAQTGDPVPAARRKLDSKQVDFVVANDVTAAGAGFDVETNQVTIVTRERTEALPLMSKADVAAAVLDRVERLLIPPPVAVSR